MHCVINKEIDILPFFRLSWLLDFLEYFVSPNSLCNFPFLQNLKLSAVAYWGRGIKWWHNLQGESSMITLDYIGGRGEGVKSEQKFDNVIKIPLWAKVKPIYFCHTELFYRYSHGPELENYIKLFLGISIPKSF